MSTETTAPAPESQVVPDASLEACRDAEARLRAAQQWLLDLRPGSLESCQNELQQSAALLETLLGEKQVAPAPPVASALRRIQHSAGLIKFQIDYASQLHLGWRQVRLGSGYTDKGLPLFASSESGSRSFEG
jgi:hypothetical protein